MHIKRKARATIVSYPQYKIRCDREPSRISYKWVPDFLMDKSHWILYKELCPKIIKTEGYVEWMPSLSFFLEWYICRSSNFIFSSKKHVIKFKLVYFFNKDSEAQELAFVLYDCWRYIVGQFHMRGDKSRILTRGCSCNYTLFYIVDKLKFTEK